MKRKVLYKLLFMVSIFLLGYSESSAQLETKLQLMQDTSIWGVYVTHNGTGGAPSTSTITGSGQVTIVAPTGFVFGALTSVAGSWTQNARVNAPTENPTMDYISVGFNLDDPQIIYSNTTETLLFTFARVGACPDTLYLIDNATDPFNVLPNSAGTNPGMDLGVYDVTNANTFGWTRNYAYSAWSCHDCDDDGYLNAIEDNNWDDVIEITDGNGQWDDPADTSDICDVCDPIHPLLAEMYGDSIMCSLEDQVPIFIAITDWHPTRNWGPYTVTYQNSAGDQTVVNNYNPEDTIWVSPAASDVFSIVSIVDSAGCVPDTIRGTASIIVEGPLNITVDPTNVTECSANGTSFSITATNGGASDIEYNWQISSDDVNFIDLDNGTPYTGVFTDELLVSDVAGLTGTYYRAKIFTETCDTVFSASAQLLVEGPLSITTQPVDSTECSGNAASFTSGAANAGIGSFSTLWQVSTDGGANFVDLSDAGVYSGTGGNTLAISDVAGLYNYQYRMKTWSATCDTLFSDPATLTVEGPIAISDQPDDVSECAGQSVSFVVAVSNSGAGDVTYQWEYSGDSTTWETINNGGSYNGVTTDTLSVDIADSLDGSCYRVIVMTGECAQVVSAAACISVSAEAEYDLNPDDATICDGDGTTFSANATVQQGTFTYQWQESQDSGANWADLANNATYSDVTTSTLTITGATVAMNGYLYRVQAVTGDCDPVPSAEATLNVEGPISIDIDPQDVTICSGLATSFDVTASNPGYGVLEYQWQASLDDVTFFNLSNAGVYNGVYSSNLSISNTSGLDQTYFRVIVTTPNCANTVSNSALLTVEGPVDVTDQPDDVTICSGDGTTFEATVVNQNSGTMSYQWQGSSDWHVDPDSINFSDLSDGAIFSGTNTTTLTLSDVAGLTGWVFRLEITTGACAGTEAFFSLPAQLTVEGPLSIDLANQPQDVTACADGTVLFTTVVNNPGEGNLNYQWQVKVPAGVWTNLVANSTYGGVRSDTLIVTNLTAAMNGDSMRVQVWTDTCANMLSQSAALIVEGPIVFDSSPENDTICSGGNTSFTSLFSNPGAGTGSPLWQVSTDGGSTWNDLSNGGVYSDVATTTLVMTGVDSSYSSNQYRMSVTLGTCGTEFSDPATLFVEGPIRFAVDGDPDDITACSGDGVTFEVETLNGGAGTIEYLWQVSINGGSSWTDLVNNATYNGATAPILSIVDIAGFDQNQYRCVISSGECSTETSASATLTVEGPMSWSAEPNDITVCSGGDTIMVATIVNGNSGNVSLQWETSSDGINFSDIANGAIYDDVDNDTLQILDVTGLGGRYYRLTATTPTCSQIETRRALLTVEGPLNFTAQPQDITECSSNSIVIAAGVSNPGAGVVNYQWERQHNGVWTTLLNSDPTVTDNIFGGVRTDTLTISDIISDSINGDNFRVNIWTATCNYQTSNVANVTIEGPLVITDSPNDTTVCSGEPASFEMSADIGTGGTLNYQWQISTNGGVTWMDLSNAAPYSNVNTATLSISDVAGLGGRRYRCEVQTAYCLPEYTDMARLTVEGPIDIVGPDSLLQACINEAQFFNATVTNNGAGTMSFQWQVLDVPGNSWSDLATDNWVRGVNTPVLQLDSMPLQISRGDTVFRIAVSTGACTAIYSQAALLHIVSDTLGHCDFDLDGLINDIDLDDDNDGLADIWEYSCMHYAQFDPDADDDGNMDGAEDFDGDQITNNEETDADGVLDGDPCDPCDPLVSINCFGISLELNALLYGAATNGVTVDTMMRDDLREKGLIPLASPYDSLGNYDNIANNGFEHVYDGGYESTTTQVLDVTGDDAIIDWVFIELRSANKIDSVITTKAALLQADGDVVAEDGVSPVTFSHLAGEYYVALRHRNHLGVMTNDAPELSPVTRKVDFRDTSIARQGLHPMKKVGGKSYMWAGDLNHDHKAIYQGPNNDIFSMFLKVLADPGNTLGNANYIIYGYLDEDYDMDGQLAYQGPNNDRIKVLLQTIISHNGNENILANFIVLEQLP